MKKMNKKMNTNDFNFITLVSGLVNIYSQFPAEVCDWIGCQFALESAYGKSSLARDYNNYCGMRNPLVRISTSIHAGDGNYYWAQYLDLNRCVLDYLLCVQYYCPLSCDYDNIAHYSKFISNFYCPQRDYIDKINIIYQQFQSQQNEYKF